MSITAALRTLSESEMSVTSRMDILERIASMFSADYYRHSGCRAAKTTLLLSYFGTKLGKRIMNYWGLRTWP